MLLPLLGACALVGPFQGPEWEPVRGLLSEDRSCRDPRCCGNLLVLCLFLIWLVQHYWHQVTRTRPSMRKVTKVPPQKWAVLSVRHDTCLKLTPEFFFSLGDFSGLDAHVQQWAQKKMYEHRRNLRESRTQNLLSRQHPCQDPPMSGPTHVRIHTPSEPIFCTTSFSSTCMIPQDSSWEAWSVPWCLSDEQSHLICKPLSPSLDMYQRMEELLVHSQEELVPQALVVSMRSHLTPMTSVTSLSNLPSSQRAQFCSREFLSGCSNQQVEVSPWKSWSCPQEAWALGTENRMLGREDSRETQALGWANQTENSREVAWEIQATGRQLPESFEMGDDTETKALEWRSQRLVVSKTDGDIPTPASKSQDQRRMENRAKIQELEDKNKREAEGENPPETQAHTAENQEHLRCKADAETQTPEWGNQDKSQSEDAIETLAFENKKEARGKDAGGTQFQGLGKQGQTGSENGKETHVSGWGKQDKIRDDTGIEIQAQERRNKAQVGGENAVRSQVSARENLGEVKREEGVQTQALGRGKQEHTGSEIVTEIQTPRWEDQDRGGSENSGKIQASRGEIRKQLRHELLVRWRNQGLRRGEDAGETQISRRKNLREIKEEDWVVIQAPWWGDQRPVVSEIDREFEIQCWGNQNQIGGEHRVETQATEKREQRKDGDEDSINTLAPGAENQGQVRHETHVDTHSPERRNQEQFGDENSIGVQALGTRNLRRVKDEDSKETQELGEENEGHLSSKINGKIHTPKWKNQEYIRGKDGANTEASEAENRGELTSKINGETQSVEWKKEEQAGEENGAEIQAPEKTSQTEARGEGDAETREAGEENRSQLKGVIDRKTHLPERKNQEQIGGENGTEIQAPEKRNQREAESEDVVETQRPEREHQGRLDNESGESHSAGRSNWEQTGRKEEENQTLGKKSQREAGSEDGGKTQGLRRGSQGLINSKVNEKSCSPEWKSQEQMGGEHGADTHTHKKRNLGGTTGDDGTETQAPGGDCQGPLRSEIDGEIQIQGQGNKNKAGDENAKEIQAVGSLRKCRAEEAGGPHVPRGGHKEQVRGKAAAKGSLPVDSSGGGGPPALTGSGYGAMEQEQAVASSPCPETKPLPHQNQLFLLASGEGGHLVSQSMASAKKHREEVGPASQQAPPESQRSRRRDKKVGPGKAPGLTWQLQNLPFLAAPLGSPSACPSVSCGRVPQTATALVGAPIALTVMPKWPVLKKSRRLLLESLMRRKIAHLKWGLPQRILESHLLFNLLGPCPLPLAGARLPGLYTACEFQQQQERRCEANGFRPDLKSTERSQRVQPPERKSSKLPTRVRALEKCGPMGISIHSEKPGRVRPPGGAREPQAVQEEAPPRAKPVAHRNPRPTAQSRSWCGQEPSREAHSSSEENRDRKTVGPAVSQMAERAPCRARTSYSGAGHDHWRKECTSREAPKSPGLKCQQPPPGRRGRLESAEGRGAGQQPSSCSTNTSSLKDSLHSAAERLSMTLLNKVSLSPHLAKPQHSAPNLNLRGPDPARLSKVGDLHARKDSPGVHSSLKRDLQPRGHCCAGAALPKAERSQGQEEPKNLNGAPQNPSAPQKFGFMKHLRCFLLRHGFRK